MNDSASEKRWLIFLTIILIVITTIPYAIGFFQDNNSAWMFSGFVFGVEDGNSYIAKMLSGSFGNWLFRTPYTAYPQKGFLAFLPYLLLGKLASPPDIHLQLIVLFHLFRWAGIYFLAAETYKFVNIFIQRKGSIQLAVILSLLGGGLGWLAIFFTGSNQNISLPLEFYSPESFGFLSIFGLPHLCFSRALMLKSFRTLLKPKYEYHPFKNHLVAGFYLFLSGFFQPLNMALGWLIIGSYKAVQFIYQKERNLFSEVKLFFSYISLSLPFLIYNFLMFTLDPYLKNWEQQNIIKSPPLTDYLLAYALAILCIIYVLAIKKNQFPNKRFLIVWLIIFPVLVYLPVNLQRRLSDGIWVCMSILIALTVSSLKMNILKYIFVTPFILSTVVIFSGSLSTVLNYNYPVYQDADLIPVFQSIESSGIKNDVVVANYEISNILPAYIPVRVIIGHGPESKNLAELERKINQLFTHRLSEQNYESFINEFNIKFIIYSNINQFGAQESDEYYLNQEIIFSNNKFQVVKIN